VIFNTFVSLVTTAYCTTEFSWCRSSHSRGKSFFSSSFG